MGASQNFPQITLSKTETTETQYLIKFNVWAVHPDYELEGEVKKLTGNRRSRRVRRRRRFYVEFLPFYNVKKQNRHDTADYLRLIEWCESETLTIVECNLSRYNGSNTEEFIQEIADELEGLKVYLEGELDTNLNKKEGYTAVSATFVER
jgi:hypothetical protein